MWDVHVVTIIIILFLTVFVLLWCIMFCTLPFDNGSKDKLWSNGYLPWFRWWAQCVIPRKGTAMAKLVGLSNCHRHLLIWRKYGLANWAATTTSAGTAKPAMLSAVRTWWSYSPGSWISRFLWYPTPAVPQDWQAPGCRCMVSEHRIKVRFIASTMLRSKQDSFRRPAATRHRPHLMG